MELRELLAYCVDLFIMLRKLKILYIIHNAYLVILLLVFFAKIESRSLFLPYLILISHIPSLDTETFVLFKIFCSSIVCKYTSLCVWVSPFSLPPVWSQRYMLCSVLCGCNPILEITLSCSTCWRMDTQLSSCVSFYTQLPLAEHLSCVQSVIIAHVRTCQ